MRGYTAIGLVNPKTKENFGSVLRAMHCYDSSLLLIKGARFEQTAPDTYKEWRHTPVIQTNDLRESIPYGCVPIAIELKEGAKPLMNFTHPERALYIFGPEDGDVPNETLAWCRDIVYIPTRGCMNLAATVNVVLYDRMSKAN